MIPVNKDEKSILNVLDQELSLTGGQGGSQPFGRGSP
jgi:hypothetical protein